MANQLHERIRQRLDAIGKPMRQASLDGGLSEDAISKLLRSPDQSQTLETIEKLASGLETTPEWLAYGIERTEAGFSDRRFLVVDRDVLRKAVRFVLGKAGAPDTEAALVADIFPEALEGPAVDDVDRDPFLWFRIRLQLGAEKSASLQPT